MQSITIADIIRLCVHPITLVNSNFLIFTLRFCCISIAFYTGCPTRYLTRHFFNNSKTNEDIATKHTHTTDTHYRHTLQTHTTDTHYRHTLQTRTTDTHYRHALQTRTTDTHYRHALQTRTTDTHYRQTLQTRTTDTHYRHALQTHTTDTHYRHTLQTHSSSFLTQQTYSCSNFVAISSLVLELLKKFRVR